MTSPSVDILDGIMPYGLNVSANTSSTYITPDGDSSRVDGSFIRLPVGPCQIQFTWPGKQDAYVRWVDSANNEKGVPIEISGGGVFPQDRYHRRSPRRQTTGAHPHQRRAGNNRNRHDLPDSALTRAVVKHDHTTGSTGRYSAVRDSLQDEHWGLYGAGGGAALHRRVLYSARRRVSNSAGIHGAGGCRGVVEARRVRREDHQDVRYSRRLVRGAEKLQTAHHSGERGGAAVNHHDTPPERRRPAHIHRFAAYLPTTPVAAGGGIGK